MNVRPYRPGDEQQILEMDWRLFPDPWNKRNLANWQWKYAGNNPAGGSIIYVMEHDGKIIAHFAVVPYRVRVYGEDLLASHSIASMVLPEYQGRGLIKFVADPLLKEVAEQGIVFTYGFPNQLAYDLQKTLMGYSDVAPIETLEKPASAKVIKKSGLGTKVLPIQKFDRAQDTFWDKVRDEYPIAVIRNAAFLNWRYLERPDQKYFAFGYYEDKVLSGYMVLKLYQDDKTIRGHIVDIFSPGARKDIALSLLEAAEEYFARHNASTQSAWVTGSELYKETLLAQGYRPVRSRPLIGRVNIDPQKHSRMLDGRQWYFTMGDSTEIF